LRNGTAILSSDEFMSLFIGLMLGFVKNIYAAIKNLEEDIGVTQTYVAFM